MKCVAGTKLSIALGLAVSCWLHSAAAAEESSSGSRPAATYTAVSQEATLSADGMLRGQLHALVAGSVSNVEGMQLSVIGPNGQELPATSDAQGKFAVAGQGAGIYCIMGRSPGAVLSQAIRVRGADKTDAPLLHLFTMNQFDTTIERALMAPISTASRSESAQSNLGSESPHAATIANGRVLLSSEGLLRGQLWSTHSDLTGTAITVYQNGIVVARSLANEQGEFQVSLKAGHYGLVVSGGAGHAAIGFEAVAPSPNFSAESIPNNVRFVALAAAQISPELTLGLSNRPLPPLRPATSSLPPQPFVQGTVPTFNAFGGGGFGGAGIGGGGLGGAGAVGGGFGGVGGLLGIGGLAVGVSSLADDDTPVVSASGQ